jgi:hypothetical protein
MVVDVVGGGHLSRVLAFLEGTYDAGLLLGPARTKGWAWRVAWRSVFAGVIAISEMWELLQGNSRGKNLQFAPKRLVRGRFA